MSIATLDRRLQSFWPAPAKPGQSYPMAFCHVEGEEESSSIKTEHSNQQSKANEKEVKKVVSLLLIGPKKSFDYSYTQWLSAKDYQSYLDNFLLSVIPYFLKYMYPISGPLKTNLIDVFKDNPMIIERDTI